MQSISTISINSVVLEYYRKQETIFIFNTCNKRYLEVDKTTFNYIKSYENQLESNAILEDYLHKNKSNILNYKFLNLKLSSKLFFSMDQALTHIFNRYTCVFLIIISILTLPFILTQAMGIDTQRLSLSYIFVLWLAQFCIIFIHEVGHYQEYMKHFKRENIYCGFQIRYFCLLLFYVDVSFLGTLSKKNQIKIIVGGVKNQFILSGILSFLYLMTLNAAILLIILVNFSIMVFNLMPFMRLDGFWLVNVLIGTKNYMENFRAILTGKEPFKKNIVMWGGFNSLAIGITVVVFVINIYQNYIS